MRKFLKMLPFIVLMLLVQNVMGQIVSAAPGDWSNPSTWVGNVPPTSLDNVSIGHAVNIDNGSAVSANLIFTTGGSINFTTSTSVLSIYGNATFGDGVTNISGWTNGAKLVFTGTSTQTWTTGASSRFDFVEINKTTGSVNQAAGAAIRIGTNLSVLGGGTFTIGSGTDIEGVQFTDGTTATTPSIFVGTGSTFNIDAAAASFVRSGTSGTSAIGSVTVNGTMNLGTTSGNGFQFGAVVVGDGTNAASLNITTNMGASGLYNFSGLTVNNNGTFNMNATTLAASTISGDILGTGTVVYALGSSSNHPAIDRSYGGNLIVSVATKAWATTAPRTIGGNLILNNASVLTTTLASGKLTINGDLNITGTSRLSWASGNIDLAGNLLVSSTNSVVAFYPQSASSVLTCTGVNKSFTVQTGAVVRCVATGTTPITTQFPGFSSIDFQSGSTVDYFKTSASSISIQDTYNGNNISYSKILISHAASAGGLMAVTINNPVINSSLSIAQGSATAGQTFTQTVTFANTSTLTIPSLTATSSNGTGTLAQNIVLGAQPVIVTGNVSLTDAASTSTATSCVLTINAGSLTIGGTLTVGSTGTTTPFNTPYILLNDAASVLTVTGTTTLRSLEQTNGAIKFTNNSQIINFNGSCITSNGNSGAEVFNFNGTNATINFNNNFTDAAAGTTFFVTGTETPNINFNNGTLASPLTSSSASLRGNVTVNGYRQITGTNFRTSNASTAAYSMTISGILDLGTNGSSATNTGGGTNTLNGNGTIKLTGDYATKISGYSTNNFQSTGTLHLNGSTNQNLPVGTYNNIIADNTVSVTLGGVVVVNGNLNISKGALITGANNLTLGASATATIGSAGTLSITGGTTDFAGKAVTIQSDGTSTGRIANVTGDNLTTGLINATSVTVQRYIPGKSTRRFSFIASPVSQALSAAWQQQVHITGAGTSGTACPTLTAHSNGFDATVTNAPSMFSYDASLASGSRWTANTTGTTGFTLTPGTGYRLNVRGPRATGCSLLDGTTTATTAVTLSATGAISNAAKNLGTFTNTYNNNATTGEWILIGNPYPSEIDFLAFRADAANSGVINASYIIYDPANAPDAVTPANMYSTWNAGTWSNAPTSISNANGQYIANGQAFFVQASAPSANITLTFKESFKYSGSQNGVFRQRSWNDIIRIGLNKDAVNIDNTVIRYANDNGISNNQLGELDATLMSTGNSYLGTLKAGKTTAIQTRQLQTLNTDTVAVDFNVAASGAYSFNFSEHDNFSATNIYLLDRYTKTTQEVKANPVYSFTVDKNNAATQTNRFALVFSKAIPVTAITGVKVYPNPADKQITLQLPQTSDKYTVSITDVAGKRVYQSQLASGTQSINVAKFTAGNYIIEITDTKGNRTTEKLVKQ